MDGISDSFVGVSCLTSLNCGSVITGILFAVFVSFTSSSIAHVGSTLRLSRMAFEIAYSSHPIRKYALCHGYYTFTLPFCCHVIVLRPKDRSEERRVGKECRSRW